MNKTKRQRIGKILNGLSVTFPWLAKRILFRIFQTPVHQHLSQKDKHILTTAQHSTIALNGIKHACYHWKGSGKKILLLHGWGSQTARWRFLLPFLQSMDMDIWSVDAPAHGATDGKIFNPELYAEIAEHILRKENIDIAIGHSAGAYSLLYMLAHSPVPMDRIILLAPTFDIQDVITGLQKILYLSDHAKLLVTQYFEERFKNDITEFRADKLVNQFQVPVYLIHDQHDKILPVSGADQIATSPNVKSYVKTVGFGHSLQHDKVYKFIVDSLNA